MINKFINLYLLPNLSRIIIEIIHPINEIKISKNSKSFNKI